MTCTACFQSAQTCTQGDAIIIVFYLRDEDGNPIELRKLSVDVLLSSERSVFRVIQYRVGDLDNTLQIDADGYLAFELTGEDTKNMSGEYYIDIVIASENTSIQMNKTFALEVVPSLYPRITR